MSTRIYLFAFSREVHELSCELINKSMMALEPASADPWALVTRKDSPDDSWDAHLEDSGLPDGTAAVLYRSPKYVHPKCPLNEVGLHFLNNDLPVTADVLGAKYRLHNDLLNETRSMPSSVRNNFDFANCVFTFGWHDIFFPGDELQPPQFIARPLVSVHFWGYGSPHLDTFLSKVRELYAFKSIENSLSALWGRTEFALIPVYG